MEGGIGANEHKGFGGCSEDVETMRGFGFGTEDVLGVEYAMLLSRGPMCSLLLLADGLQRQQFLEAKAETMVQPMQQMETAVDVL